MPNAFKPSGAKDTASFEQRFNKSLLQLTLFYAATLAVILFISGLITYSSFSNRLGHRFHEYPAQQERILEVLPNPMPTADQVKSDLISSLIAVNSLLLLLAGFLSYWLAKLTLKPIKNAYQQQQRFLSDASHELRTPLSILQADLENELSDAAVQGQNRERAASNLEEVERMGKLVNDLLLLSRLDENENNIRKNASNIELKTLIDSIIKRLQALANSQNVSLVSNLKEGENISISSHEDLLSHALINLIKNAIIYNKPGGSVVIDIQNKGELACIVIKDTGIGMSPEDLDNIFNRFYRSDKSRSRQSGGSGLGLSIAQTSIEHIKGTINIESELNKGTKVTICLPKS